MNTEDYDSVKQPKKPKPRVMPAKKAFENMQFLYSREGRSIRITAEYLFPQQYFHKHNVDHTIVFFGSARSISTEDWVEKMENLQTRLKTIHEEGSYSEETAKIQKDISKLKRIESLCKYYDETVELSEKVCEWVKELPDDKKLYVCTGGGPGMMEAANRGAFNTWSHTIGLNISLPHEQFPNQYISPDLNFEFHYFFMRKFWFVYHAKAIVVMPGGFGTFDELMEMLTLEQTNVLNKRVPIILYGEDFWKKVINFDMLSDMGLIDAEDLKLFKFANTPDEALKILQDGLDSFISAGYLGQ